MRTALLLVAALAFATVGLSVTPVAAACNPPNCPGFGGCHVTYDYVYLSDPVGPVYAVPVPNGWECYY